MLEKKNNPAIAGSLLLVVIMWGANNVGTKWLVATWPPIFTGATRFLIAGGILLAVLRFTKLLGEFKPIERALWPQLWLRGGFGLAAYIVPFCWALHLTAASANDPSNLELHYVLAESCLRARQQECALAESQKILALDPNSGQAHMLLGEAYDGTSKTSEAIAEFSAAATANPALPDVHFGLGYLYWKKQDYQPAEGRQPATRRAACLLRPGLRVCAAK